VAITRPPYAASTPAKRHRRCGTGPPARFLITWILLSDPGLRSALEYVATTNSARRARTRALRRRALVYTTCVALLISLMTRLLLALV
jgi:hypothetical protein